MMKRYAEDRIWANDIEEGKSVLKFLITLMEGRKGIKAMIKGEFSKGSIWISISRKARVC